MLFNICLFFWGGEWVNEPPTNDQREQAKHIAYGYGPEQQGLLFLSEEC
jgi:hypothetical protein